MKSLCIILPAYNEAKAIGPVMQKLQNFVKKENDLVIEIVVIDDGSTDQTFQICQTFNVTVLHHIINRGLGGALATGIEYAKMHNFDFALTMDSDGQHDINDLPKAIKLLINNDADVVIGSRMMGQKGMPKDRLIINFTSNVFTYILFGFWTTDSQSGFRGFNRKALGFINVKTQGMEVSSELFTEIKKHNLKLLEVPISVIYTEYSRNKGQSNLNSLNVVVKLLLRKFR